MMGPPTAPGVEGERGGPRAGEVGGMRLRCRDVPTCAEGTYLPALVGTYLLYSIVTVPPYVFLSYCVSAPRQARI